MKIRFYKEDSGRWYADIPEYIEEGGTCDDLEMVCGADLWLDIIAQGNNEVTLRLSTDSIEGYERLTLVETDPENAEDGAWYQVGTFKGIAYNHKLWLCPVTLFVFGEYPKMIYYK